MKIALIGSFCNDRESASGQAVRTTIFYNALCQRYGKDTVFCVNTHGFRKNPIKVLIRTLIGIKNCKHIVIMAHENGRKIFFPILYYAAKYMKRLVYHNVIGGSFAEYLEENPRLIKYSKAFKIHWVQMNSQVNKLLQLGLQNVELLPNTKNVQPLKRTNINDYNDTVFKFCTFSRISEAKGIERAINAIECINKKNGSLIATLDIYGIPDDDYKERFEEIIAKSTDAIKYKGFIGNNDSIETLCHYYMLLFPTTYQGEGFPGTVWDAFASGLPIIATNWHYNAEIITDGLNGLIYDYNDKDGLINCIRYAIKNETIVNKMREKCLVEANKYLPEKVFPIVFKYFDDK